MKLCIDCKYYQADMHGTQRCGNPSYAYVSPVDGSKRSSDCMIQRTSFVEPCCGKDATGFEAKVPDEL